MKTRLLGIDHGDSRIGLAISDELGSFAHPYRTLQAGGPVIDEIRAIVERERISGIIIGLPKNMDGSGFAWDRPRKQFPTFPNGRTFRSEK